MQISITLDGAAQMSRRFENLASVVQDWTPALEESAQSMIDVFSGEVFETAGASIDEPWTDLNETYARRKAKVWPSAGILVASGTMQQSFTKTFDSTTATVRNAMDYFKYHQSSLPRGKMPRRMMMKITENIKQSVVKIFQEHLFEQMQ